MRTPRLGVADTSIVVTKACVVKPTTAGTAVPIRSIAGDRGTTVTIPEDAAAYSADAAPLIDGACGWIGVRMTARVGRHGADFSDERDPK